MYTPTTLQTPRGLMTRPQLYAIGHKVNSLLSEPSLPTCETWLLPHIYVLCMTRNKEEDHGQDGEDTKYKDQEKKLPEATAAGRPTRTGRPTTPRLRTTGPLRTTVPATTEPNLRTSEELRTSGPREPPDERPLRTSDRSAPEPNLRKSEEHRTSGPSRASGRPEPSGRPTPVCAQCVGPQPMYPFTYPFVALDYIYSSTSS